MRTLLAAALLAATSIATSQGIPGGGHTSMRLLSDAASIRPGTTFTVGVVLTMDKGWHTYWKNPGDAGIATDIRWELPEGLSAGQIQWPVPQKKIDPGDVLFFGYSGETMLFVPISVAATARLSSSVTLKADGSWLECEAVCIPGEGTASLTLPVRGSDPEPANVAMFTRYRALLPRPPADFPDLSITTETSPASVSLRVRSASGWAKGGEPDFYPEPMTDATPGRTTVTVRGDSAVLSIPFAAGARPPASMAGVLVYSPRGGERRAVAFTIPLAASTPLKPFTERSFTLEEASGEQTSLGLYLLFALIGGLLLNIMPCVLPVIALKVFGMVKMAGDQPRRIKRLGWMFSLGILSSFLALASTVILLKLAGQQVGWGFQFQEPIFVIIMGAVVFAFGLSLFGVFEIQLPGAAVTGVSNVINKQGSEGGYAASFLEGVFATILATPCTAPFLGTALGFAFAQPWWLVLLIFSVVAVGMALPYLLLTAKPAWMKFLPKPGAWMETAKQFMGFLMMGTLLWLLYIFGKQLGMEAVIGAAAFLLTVGIAAWLIGRFATLSAKRRTYWLAWAGALAVTVVGFRLFLTPVLQAQEVLSGPSPAGSSTRQEGIAWRPFTTRTVEELLQQHRTVFIDFTAEWCLTCKVNEKTVLADPDVIGRFTSLGIVAVKADWTNRNPEITRLLSQFGRSGVPLYVIFPAASPDRPIVLPEVITKGIVMEAMARATK
jgi:thiol:disulfide interchange protein/DsbC/DsbD-like thiol-disulfide interchange protein